MSEQASVQVRIPKGTRVLMTNGSGLFTYTEDVVVNARKVRMPGPRGRDVYEYRDAVRSICHVDADQVEVVE